MILRSRMYLRTQKNVKSVNNAQVHKLLMKYPKGI